MKLCMYLVALSLSLSPSFIYSMNANASKDFEDFADIVPEGSTIMNPDLSSHATENIQPHYAKSSNESNAVSNSLLPVATPQPSASASGNLSQLQYHQQPFAATSAPQQKENNGGKKTTEQATKSSNYCTICKKGYSTIHVLWKHLESKKHLKKQKGTF